MRVKYNLTIVKDIFGERFMNLIAHSSMADGAYLDCDGFMDFEYYLLCRKELADHRSY